MIYWMLEHRNRLRGQAAPPRTPVTVRPVLAPPPRPGTPERQGRFVDVRQALAQTRRILAR